eukprot:2977062-Rhodomonas_salina.1
MLPQISPLVPEITVPFHRTSLSRPFVASGCAAAGLGAHGSIPAAGPRMLCQNRTIRLSLLRRPHSTPTSMPPPRDYKPEQDALLWLCKPSPVCLSATPTVADDE